jgi:hypothetical protein
MSVNNAGMRQATSVLKELSMHCMAGGQSFSSRRVNAVSDQCMVRVNPSNIEHQQELPILGRHRGIGYE